MENSNQFNIPYCDPNAYVQKFEKSKDSHRQKVVFQEPYECMPVHRLNNDFKKGDCDCIRCREKKEDKSTPPFDFKNIIPLLTSLSGGSSLKDNNILGNLLSNFGGDNTLMSLLKNLNITKLFNAKSVSKHEMKSTDFCIKDYTKVE